MSIRRIIRFNRLLLVVNLALIVAVFGLYIFGFSNHLGRGGTLEANRIVLRGESGAVTMVLQGDDGNTVMTMNDQNGNVRLQLQG